MSKINSVWLLIECKPWLELIMCEWLFVFFFALAGSFTPSRVALYRTVSHRLGEGCALWSRSRAEAKWMLSQHRDAGSPGERKAALLSVPPPPASHSGPFFPVGRCSFTVLSSMSESSNEEKWGEKMIVFFLEGQKVHPCVFLSRVCSEKSSTCWLIGQTQTNLCLPLFAYLNCNSSVLKAQWHSHNVFEPASDLDWARKKDPHWKIKWCWCSSSTEAIWHLKKKRHDTAAHWITQTEKK